ncbi:FAD/NAD(P)-binding oxidoreductase family protein [Rhynchospora pubera]|uniref:FAD/NAD(P)-binding oxidoreductase family protein n=1 Tax=Rhynchospora pubera TaxID=906938 RepID=A0AAV8GIC7_9POAL|nr:FAD/NAD(P)-binding oxidoreductase family protein [Rhynchospora pubera]
MDLVQDIVIVGAGLAGLATALGLHRKGVKSLVLESSPTMRTSGFAFTTWSNAWRVLDALGVGDKVRDHHVLLESFSVMSAASGDISAIMGLSGVQGKMGMHEVRCVRRDFLLETLATELPKDTIKYSSKIVSIEEDGNLTLLHLANGSIIRAKVLIGSDGINSVVAKYLGLKKPSSSGRWATRGFAEYPNGHEFKHEFLQINGAGFRCGFIPCSAKNMFWFFTWMPSQHGEEKVDESINMMREFVIKNLTTSKVPQEMIEVIKRSEMSEVVSSPLNYRFPMSVLFGNITKRNICVIGDALHPMTPDLGQGACSALEDSIILSRYLSDAVHQGKIEVGLEKFAKSRRWRCASVVATAYIVGSLQESSNSFVTFLRDKVLAGTMARALLKVSDYDCGNI